MRRALFVLACVLTLGILAIPRVRCWARGRGHKPKRQAVGGLRCEDCKKPGADLEEMGFEGSRVAPLRRVFSRRGGLERTSEWLH